MNNGIDSKLKKDILEFALNRTLDVKSGDVACSINDNVFSIEYCRAAECYIEELDSSFCLGCKYSISAYN